MPKVPTKKFVLVSIEGGETKQTLRRLRRYLSNHKLKYVTASNATDMMDHLDKLQNDSFVFQENVDAEEDFDNGSPGGKAIITTNPASSHQEALEQWARDAFSEGSEEMQLMFGALAGDQEELAEEISDHTSEDNTSGVPEKPKLSEFWKTDIPQLFTLNSVEPDDGLENGKDDGQEMLYCQICESQIDVGRNRNTRIKRQAQHVIEQHSRIGFRGVEISRRYQCLRCYRTLPVSKSPCEHISEYHGENDIETDFQDLWNKDQLSSFNTVMDECFNRILPVPRSRRFRSHHAEEALSKSSYRIISQEDEVLQIKTVIERPHSEAAHLDELTTEKVNNASTSATRENSHFDDGMNDLYVNDQPIRGRYRDDFGDHSYSSKPSPDAPHHL